MSAQQHVLSSTVLNATYSKTNTPTETLDALGGLAIQRHQIAIAGTLQPSRLEFHHNGNTMHKRIASLILLVTSALVNAEEAKPRVWISRVGGQYLQATFVRRDNDIIMLQTPAGRMMEVDLKDLSNEDQQFAVAQSQLVAKSSSKNTAEDLPPPRPVPDTGAATASSAASSADSSNQEQGETEESVEDRLKELPKVLRTLRRFLKAGTQSTGNSSPMFGEESSVYISLSGDFLNRFVQIPFQEDREVEEVIKGATVRGTAATTGMISLDLLPNEDKASVQVVVKGRANSQTTGRQLILDIHSDGTTQFEAKKRIDISTKGIGLYEASATAQAQVNKSAVSTPLQGRVGNLITRIGGIIVEAQRDEIDYEASERAAYRAAKDLDQRIDTEVVRLQKVLTDLAPGIAKGEPVVPIQFRTSSETLAVLVGERTPPDWQELSENAGKIAGKTAGETAGETAGKKGAKKTGTQGDITVVLPKETVDTAKRMQTAMRLFSMSFKDQLKGIDPAELQPARTSWSDDEQWLTLEWDVDGTLAKLMSKDFYASTAGAVSKRPEPQRVQPRRSRFGARRRDVFRPAR